ncbi:uncharacterized protein LOC134282294 isoform X1 [Saccostrea cucullata]|uniref:uncharacterized protein LOC134282294 isoform X1 n=1 Tax=Saccostrea cuccullata TaxID=36930 RepID=UPI002ED24BE5
MKKERIKDFLLFSYLFVSMTCSPETPNPCEGSSECCSGYFLDNKTKTCVGCPVGYIGPNCKLKCPFPTFGHFCQSNCECNIEKCHFTTGCIQNLLTDNEEAGNTIFIRETKSQSHNYVPKEKENSGKSSSPNENDMKKMMDDDDSTTNNEKISTAIIVLVGFSGFLVTVYIITLICNRGKSSYKLNNKDDVFLIDERAIYADFEN